MSAIEPTLKQAEDKGILGVTVKLSNGIIRNVLVAVTAGGNDPNAAIQAEIERHIPDGTTIDWQQVGTTSKGISPETWERWELDDCEVLY
jgi:hypothetical protein